MHAIASSTGMVWQTDNHSLNSSNISPFGWHISSVNDKKRHTCWRYRLPVLSSVNVRMSSPARNRRQKLFSANISALQISQILQLARNNKKENIDREQQTSNQ